MLVLMLDMIIYSWNFIWKIFCDLWISIIKTFKKCMQGESKERSITCYELYRMHRNFFVMLWHTSAMILYMSSIPFWCPIVAIVELEYSITYVYNTTIFLVSSCGLLPEIRIGRWTSKYLYPQFVLCKYWNCLQLFPLKSCLEQKLSKLLL